MDLVRLEESAYGAFLGFVGENLVIVGDGGIHFVTPGEPPHFHACPTGTHRALLGDDVVYYEGGRFFLQPARGGARREFFREPLEPKSVAAGSRGFLWITSDGKDRLAHRAEGATKILHETDGALLALTVDAERAYFVEGAASGEWRLGTVELGTRKVTFGPLDKTRSPSALAASGRPYYYDGPKRSVFRMNASFTEPEVVADDVICSPLATFSERVFCAHVGGLGEVRLGRRMTSLPAEVHGPVTALAVNETHLAWLEDSGRNAVLARILELPR